MSEKENQEVFNNLLNITRDQLHKSMNLNAELEALLRVEKSKNEELTKTLEELKKNSLEKK